MQLPKLFLHVNGHKDWQQYLKFLKLHWAANRDNLQKALHQNQRVQKRILVN